MFYAQPPPARVPLSLILRSNGSPLRSTRLASDPRYHEPAPTVPIHDGPPKQDNNMDMPPWLHPQSGMWFERLSLDRGRTVNLVPTAKKRKRGAHGHSKSEPTGAQTSSKRKTKIDGLLSTEGVPDDFRWSHFGPDEMQQAMLLDQVLHKPDDEGSQQPSTLDLELASWNMNMAFAVCDLTLGASSCPPSSLGGDGLTDHPLPELHDSSSTMPGMASGPVSVFGIDGKSYSPGVGMTFDKVPPAPGIRPLQGGPLDNMPHGDNGAQPAIEADQSSRKK
ncbi:uncharacterized protein J7T54_001121 [Emericellopsis cladophorae]|uniref:Uncharacterized protein n=1 Tax=Emericellopsis cladophorae TaxID=2686198 RepID=A0A9P9Y0D2_9HYPO|nr:uncharacterized protein J7T54_001121 [Emericellopsis cladophorae]KAI6780813.1 hypothetical protein J7T54_001121 [Emericellopsis cladophorae]